MVRSVNKRKWRAVGAFQDLGNSHWAIYEPALQELLVKLAHVAESGEQMDCVESSLDPSSLTIVNGTALIPVEGVIIPRPSDRYWGAVTACTDIAQAVKNAMANDSVSRVVGLFDTPGGSVMGLAEAAAEIFSLRGKKPMAAYVDGAMCASAGYFLASAFGSVYASASSLIGSIGSVYPHESWQGYLEKLGVKIENIHFGKHKVDGSPYKDLNDQSRATLQELVDSYGTQFISATGQNRGITPKAVMDSYGQGKVFIAEKAKAVGLIDGVMTREEVLSQLSQRTKAVYQSAVTFNESGSSIEDAMAIAATANPATLGGWKAVERATEVARDLLAQDAYLKNLASSVAPTKPGVSSLGAKPKGGLSMTPKLKAALYALELIDAIDASDEICQAAINVFCRARGEDVPKDEAATIKLLTSQNSATLVATLEAVEGAVAPLQKPVMSATEYRKLAKEVYDSAALINNGREEPLITEEHITKAVDAIAEGALDLAGVQSSWKKLVATDPTRVPISVQRVAEDAFLTSAVNVLASRMGLKVDKEPPRDMRNMSLHEIGVKCASFTGLRLYGDKEDQCEQLLQVNPLKISFSEPSYNRAGDFPTVLSNLVGKIFDAAIELVDPTYPLWSQRLQDVPDFKPKTVMGVGVFDNLSEIMDDEEPKQLKFAEELKGFIQVGQFGNVVHLTPRMMADDDMDAFTQQLSSLAQAHEFALNSLCVNILIANPTLPDGVTLFHADHENLIASAPGVPSDAEADKVRLMMQSQTGIGTTRTIKVFPRVILTPNAQVANAEKTYIGLRELFALGGETKVSATDTGININRRNGTVVIAEPELDAASTTAWYAMDPRFRTIVHAFQKGFGKGGKRTSWYENGRGSRVYKIEGRFGAAAVGHRGILKDPGA